MINWTFASVTKRGSQKNLYIFLASLQLYSMWDIKSDSKASQLARLEGIFLRECLCFFHFHSSLGVANAPTVFFTSQSKALHRLTLKFETRQNVMIIILGNLSQPSQSYSLYYLSVITRAVIGQLNVPYSTLKLAAVFCR